MTSSSSEPAATVIADTGGGSTLHEGRLGGLGTRELRTGGWTRLGSSSVLGDAVTEHTLSGLAEQAQAAARAQGYATGWAQGRRAAEERAEQLSRQVADQRRLEDQRREAEHRAAVDALAEVATRLQESLQAVCTRVESHAIEVAMTLTEQLVGHELAVAETPVLDAVRRALALIPGEPVTRIRVHPQLAADRALAELAGSA